MNRLEYWIRAQTQYRLHSPFLFEMYRKVLFAEVGGEAYRAFAAALPEGVRQQAAAAAGGRRRYFELVYKLSDHYGLRVLSVDADEAVLQGPPAFGSLKAVCQPHRRRARELRWMAQQGNDKYNVSIDLYDAGLLLSNPKLHPQHFILK